MKLDTALRIRVRDLADLPWIDDVRPEFLADFAPQRLLAGLPLVALSTGELPAVLQMGAAQPAGHEETPVTFDDGGDDDDGGGRHFFTARRPCFPARAPAGFFSTMNGNAAQIEAIGHARHPGFRAAQITAPKSINAWLKSKARR